MGTAVSFVASENDGLTGGSGRAGFKMLGLQKNPRLLNSAGDAVASFGGTGVRKELGHPQSIGIGLKSKCRDWRFRRVACGVEHSEKRH